MNKSKAYNYFQAKFGLTKSSNGWYRFVFPLGTHKDESAAVNFGVGYVKDHRSGYTARIASFIMDVEDCSYKEAVSIVEEYTEAEEPIVDRRKFNNVSVVKLPDGFRSLLEVSGTIGKRAINYLESRNFDVELLDSMGFGYVSDSDSDFYGRIIIPYKIDGVLRYYTGRDFLNRDHLPKYRNPKGEDVGIGKSELLFNEDALNMYDRVWITEGWADAVTIGDDACAIGGWIFSRTQLSKIIRSSVKEVVIVPDKGMVENSTSTFYQKALQGSLQLVDYKNVKVINPELIEGKGKDVNEYGLKALYDRYRETDSLSYRLAMRDLV